MKDSTYFIKLFFIMLIVTNCNKREAYIDVRGTDYAGDQTCIQCHQSISNNVMQSPHDKATAPGTIDYVLGDFSGGDHVFYFDKDTKVVMEKRKDSFYQVLYKNDMEINAYNIAVVFGSRNAQTSVYWKNHNAYELPISYYTAIQKWGTSPGSGFPSDKPNFDRRVIKDCFACHSSNVASKKVTGSSEESNFMTRGFEDIINPETIVYGIDCERCHGPAKTHVEYHLRNPNQKMAKHITNYKTLNRQQRLDGCAVCHSGDKGLKIKSRFDFKIGDNLSDYYRHINNDDPLNIDVHGNQYQLLLQSNCFIKSVVMECTTCHNAHNQTNKSVAYYSNICMGCHKGVEHDTDAVKEISKETLEANCIDCHMPKKSSKAIQFHLELDPKYSNYMLRSHRIAVYSNERENEAN